MGDYICLSCGIFQNGDESRRMYNHCPACEQNSSDPDETDVDSLHWNVNFHDKGLPPVEKRQKIELLIKRCLECEKGGIDLQKIQFPHIN